MKKPWYKAPTIWLALLIPLMILVGVVIGNLLVSPRQEMGVVKPSEPPAALREAILYFGSQEGTHLIGEVHELKECGELADCLTETIQALIQGPNGDLLPVFPSATRIREVTEEGGVATVNFSRELVSAHPGGTLSELLTVYSLADTLAANFPHIRQVRVLIEGQPTQTLKGHVDLRQPVTADFRWAREVAAPGAATDNPGAGKER